MKTKLLKNPIYISLFIFQIAFVAKAWSKVEYNRTQQQVIDDIKNLGFNPAEDASPDELPQKAGDDFLSVFNIDVSPLKWVEVTDDENSDVVVVSHHKKNSSGAGDGKVIDVNLSRDVLTYGSMSSPMSHGRAKKPTPTGDFHVVSKDPDAYSYTYSPKDKHGHVIESSKAWMHNALFFIDGLYAIHAGNINGQSHGCIRLPPAFAARLFYAVPIGTRVHIHN